MAEPRIESGAGSASPLEEGEERRPRRKVLDFGLAAARRQPPSPQPSPSRAREKERRSLEQIFTEPRCFPPGASKSVSEFEDQGSCARVFAGRGKKTRLQDAGGTQGPWKVDRGFGWGWLGLRQGVGYGAEADAVAGFEEDGVVGLEGVAEVALEGFAGSGERVGVVEGG